MQRQATYLSFWHALVLLCSVSVVVALPAFDGFFGRSSMGAVVPGASPIEGLSALRRDDQESIPWVSRHLTTYEAEGVPANVTLLPNYRQPPIYYVNKDILWQYINGTTILPVNVHNVTESAQTNSHPNYQLKLGQKVEGVRGTWRFSGSMLYHDFPGKVDTVGLFYKCSPATGWEGIFMYAQQQEPPMGCEPFTFHTWIHQHRK
ncbi:hypothetical protein BKA70DRAFT_1557269 [Coprinopsis sp. MPI-PUGE-AT-0042]|nr:hypothetical protein BKA70DRAFT_1557269 [Coprinopsis sp. MPI-PUGE-AT-0042]